MGKEGQSDGWFPPSWEANEKSNTEAVKGLIIDAVKYSPRAYLNAFKALPGMTAGLTLLTGFVVSGLMGNSEVAVTCMVASGVVMGGSLIADISQIPLNIARHDYRDYKRGIKTPYNRDEFRIRTFLLPF